MPQLSEISYSREECISAVRGYYNFLTKLYLNESYVIEPPAEGWPDITTSTMQGLGKTDEVVSLLRHLPYIRDPTNEIYRAHGAAYCHFADWQKLGGWLSEDQTGAESCKLLTESVSLYETIPAHVVSLTDSGRDGPVFLLDTELGIILWYECFGEIKYNPSREMVEDDAYDYAEDEVQAEWRGECAAWAVSDFFEMLKDQFRELQFIPTGPLSVIDVYIIPGPGSEGLREMLQGIYREYGLPDMSKYRKVECLNAVRKALEERYPDYADVIFYGE